MSDYDMNKPFEMANVIYESGENIIISPTTSGTVTIDAVTFPTTDGTTGQVLSTNGAGTLTWANQAVGGGSALGPSVFFDDDGYNVNGPAAVDITAYTSVGVTDQRLYITPMVIPMDCTLNYFTIYISATASGATCRMGLYDDLYGVPNNLVAESAEIAIGAATGVYDSALISTAITAGYYWVCFTINENGGSVSVSSASGAKTMIWGRDVGAFLTVNNIFLKNTVDPATSLPDPISSLTVSGGNQSPHCFLKLDIS